jgi:phosphatidylserine/phosphatidylglycerophosphate/cardiolipin synthase-like enzyme
MLLLLISITINAFFSPGVRDAIISEIKGAKEDIDIAMYILTDRELSNAIIDASNRGVKVRVVLDESQSMEITYSKHIYLEGKGINVKLDGSHFRRNGEYEGIMHHKFSIIDGSTLITGSYNWTHSAEDLNDENVLIVKDAENIIKEFKKEFIKIWERSEPIKDLPTLDPYNKSQLKGNIEKWVIIIGKPTHWNISRSGHLFIDFGDEKDDFTFLMWKEGVDKLKERRFNFKLLDNSVVELQGKLILHEKYGLEIVTDNPDAITIK